MNEKKEWDKLMDVSHSNVVFWRHWENSSKIYYLIKETKDWNNTTFIELKKTEKYPKLAKKYMISNWNGDITLEALENDN